jgi:hypothetical protein
MDVLEIGTKPSAFNILSKFYGKVVHLNEHIEGIVSKNRYSRIVEAAKENEEMKKLIETAYVCSSPGATIVTDDSIPDEPSTLSTTGGTANQSEVCKARFALTHGRLSTACSRSSSAVE